MLNFPCQCAALLFAASLLAPQIQNDAVVKSPSATIGGTSATGDPVRVIWNGRGGDVRTTFADGSFEELWFNNRKAIWRGRAGDTHTLDDVGALQMIRILLTHQFTKLAILERDNVGFETLGYPVSEMPTLLISLDASGGIKSGGNPRTFVFRNLKYTGEFAVNWTSYLARPSPVQVPFIGQFTGRILSMRSPLPDEPQSLWRRPAYNELNLSASVQLRPVDLYIGTNVAGLQVSQLFVDSRHLNISRDGYVELRDVVIAGTYVRRTYAKVSSDNRHDLIAGITLFPKSAIYIRRDGQARLSKTGCSSGQRIGSSGKLDFVGSSITTIDSTYSGATVPSSAEPANELHGWPNRDNRTMSLQSFPVDHIIVDTGKSLVCT